MLGSRLVPIINPESRSLAFFRRQVGRRVSFIVFFISA
jgi:hypothetical protein